MSNFKKIMKAIQISEVEMPTMTLNKRKLSLEEVKELVSEEFAKAKDACSVKVKKDTQFADAELAKETDWMKEFDIKEWFFKGK